MSKRINVIPFIKSEDYWYCHHCSRMVIRSYPRDEKCGDDVLCIRTSLTPQPHTSESSQ